MGEVGEVDVAVAVEVAVVVGHAGGLVVVCQEDGEVGEVDGGVVVEVADAAGKPLCDAAGGEVAGGGESAGYRAGGLALS